MSEEMNKQKQKFSILKRIESFGFAFNGLKILIKEEHNSRIHLFVAIVVVIVSFIFQISSSEWILILFSISFVLVTEIINSAIENISDFISPEKHNSIKKIKDLAAAAVLISSITALIVGLIIFLPKILLRQV